MLAEEDKLSVATAEPVLSNPDAQVAVNALIGDQSDLTVAAMIEQKIEATRVANKAIGEVEAGDPLAAAKSQAAISRTIKEKLIEALITPVAEGYSGCS